MTRSLAYHVRVLRAAAAAILALALTAVADAAATSPARAAGPSSVEPSLIAGGA